MRTTYTFTYSGSWEVVKRFYKFSTLKAFLQKVPEYELMNSSTQMHKNGISYVGMYFLLKNGGLSVKF